MSPRDHVAARQRGIDARGLLGLAELHWINRALGIELADKIEIKQDTRRGAVADLRPRIPVLYVHLGIAAINREDEAGQGRYLWRCFNRARGICGLVPPPRAWTEPKGPLPSGIQRCDAADDMLRIRHRMACHAP